MSQGGTMSVRMGLYLSPGGVIYRATYAAYNGDFDDHGEYIGGDYDDQ